MQCNDCQKLILSELGADGEAGPFRCGEVSDELREAHGYQAVELETSLFALADVSACPYFVKIDFGKQGWKTYNPDVE